MFQLMDETDNNQFSWDSIGKVEKGRANLGDEMPVFVYRLFQYAIKDELNRRFGKDITADIFRNSGYLSGKEFANNMLDMNLEFGEFISSLRQALEECKIGVLRVEQSNLESGDMTITVGEDLDCSGLPITGEMVCNYDEGFLAGILELYTKKKYEVREVDCWASGSRVCRFKAKVVKD